jgi:hypothetical protein
MSTFTMEKRSALIGKSVPSRPRVISPGPIGESANRFGRRMDTVILDSLRKTVRESQWLLNRRSY